MRRQLFPRKPYLAALPRKLIVCVHAGVVAYSLLFVNSLAAQDAAQIENEQALLEKLRASDAAEAKMLARDIQRSWSRSGSASADFLLKRGRDALKAKKVDVALDHLTALTDHAPGFAEGWHMRASALYQKKLYGPALEDLSRVLALNPNHFEAIQGLGAIFEQLGNPERAYAVYQQVLTIHPHHEDVLEALKRLEPEVLGPKL